MYVCQMRIEFTKSVSKTYNQRLQKIVFFFHTSFVTRVKIVYDLITLRRHKSMRLCFKNWFGSFYTYRVYHVKKPTSRLWRRKQIKYDNTVFFTVLFFLKTKYPGDLRRIARFKFSGRTTRASDGICVNLELVSRVRIDKVM